MKFKKFPNDRQLDVMDCGAACLKMIAKYYGKYYSIQFLRDKCGVTREGVSFSDLSSAAEDLGFRTLPLKCTINDLLIRVPFPAIIHWGNNHFVVIYDTKIKKIASVKASHSGEAEISQGKIFISDPSIGHITYTIEEFASKWLKKDGKGVVLGIEPQADFYERKDEGKVRNKKTFNNFIGYFKQYKMSFVNLFFVMLLVTILQGILPFISKSVIDVGIQTHDINFVNIILIANVAIIVSILLSNIVRDWILLHVTSRVNIALISDYLIKLMRLPVTFFENKLIGDILQRAQDHERIRAFIMNNSINMIFSTLTFIVFGIILLTYNATIFLIFIVGSSMYVIWIMAFISLRKKLDWEYFDLVSKNQSYWIETISGIQDIKINNYEKSKRWKWESIQAKLYHVNLRVLKITNLQNSGGQFIDSLKNIFITFYCAKAVILGEITFGIMISTQFIIGMLNAPITQLIQFIISFQLAQISFLRLNEIHLLEDENENTGQNFIGLPSNKSLTINNVSFQYTSNSTLILQNVRLIIPEGQVTAIVGNSGSGKSTLLKLLLRLYKPSYGDIKIGEMNINNISLKQWREKCGVVMQDGKIFNDTILNNIVLDDDKIDYERLRIALTSANISSEIEQLPLGYNTVMGEGGRGLSGGQKQRILIARALYKNPDYLIFDEATNSLDTINEQKITKALENAFKGKTVVVVAHRLSTIRKANQIVVMHNGTIIEIGNHDSLMNNKSHYYQLVQSQLEI